MDYNRYSLVNVASLSFRLWQLFCLQPIYSFVCPQNFLLHLRHSISFVVNRPHRPVPNSHIIVTSQTKSNHWHSLSCFPPARRRPIPPPPCVQHCSFMPARLVFAASAAALSFQLPARAAAGRHSACTNTQLRHTHEARSHILHCMPQSGRPSLCEQLRPRAHVADVRSSAED